MATELFTHPSPEQLRGFAQGRLSSAEMAELERHIAHCDSCCLHLERVPDDTLVQLAREAATQGIKEPAATRALPATKPPIGEIPNELRDHPRYRVLSLVGHGGMGAVYKAEHRKMERLVALKVINPSLMANPQAVDRFNREFRAAAKLSHPNIVAAHDADQAGDLHFFVMEFVDGMTLDRLVARNGPYAPMHAAYLIHQAAQGLQHAHEKGMVHRDIKPQNLMLSREKKIKILDFGLIRLGADQAIDVPTDGQPSGKPGQTTAGMILGTPDYIAPEQATDARTADGRADIYSLGCTLYYLLTGQPPFPTGSTIEKLNLHLTSAPPPIATKRSDVPTELLRILDKMLAKDPAQRYQTPGELAKALAPLAKGQGGGMGQASRLPVAPTAPAPPQEAATIVTTAPADGLLPVPSTEYSVRSTSPLDDPVLGPTLALSTPPLRPMVQPARASSLPFGLTPPAAVALGVGGILLVALLAWGINAALSVGDDPQRAIASDSSAHPATSTSLNSPISSATPTNPALAGSSAPPPAPPTSAATGVIGSNLPRKVLLVVPSRGLWRADYENLAMACRDLKIELEVTSTSPNASIDTDGNSSVTPHRIIDRSLCAHDFGALIFAGKATDEYRGNGLAALEAKRLIDEFLNQNKIVSSICVGRQVLDDHGYLTNRRRANCPHLNEPYAKGGENVIEDGQFITASTEWEAKLLMRAIEPYLSIYLR